MDRIHEQRKATLLKECDGKEFLYIGKNADRVVRSHFVYDKPHRVVYCAMEKIGSTFWRRLFQVSNNTCTFNLSKDLNTQNVRNE